MNNFVSLLNMFLEICEVHLIVSVGLGQGYDLPKTQVYIVLVSAHHEHSVS